MFYRNSMRDNFMSKMQELEQHAKNHKQTLRETLLRINGNHEDPLPYLRTVTTSDNKEALMFYGNPKTPSNDDINEIFFLRGQYVTIGKQLNKTKLPFESHGFNITEESISKSSANELKIGLAASLITKRTVYNKFNGNLEELINSKYLDDGSLFLEDLNFDEACNSMNQFLHAYNETLKTMYKVLKKNNWTRLSKTFNGFVNNYVPFGDKNLTQKSIRYRWINAINRGNKVFLFSLNPKSNSQLSACESNFLHDDELNWFNCHSIEMNTVEDAEILVMLLENYVNSGIINLIFTLKELISSNTNLYTHHSFQTETKVRHIYAPNDDLKKVSKDILFILDKILGKKFRLPEGIKVPDKKKETNNDPNVIVEAKVLDELEEKSTKIVAGNPNNFQFAYRKNLSIKHNALVHVDNKYMIKFDIKGFFDNCNWDIVKKQVKTFYRDYSTEPTYYMSDKAQSIRAVIVSALQLLLINPDTQGLYQGNPLSGLISNAIMQPASRFMKNLFAKEGTSFTIYADDITISRNKKINLKSSIGKIMYAMEFYNLPFELKEEKTRKVSNNRRKVTGVVINHNDTVTVPRKKYMLLKTVLNYISNGKEVTLNDNQLRGLISYCLYIDETGKVEKLINKYEDVLNKHFGRPMNTEELGNVDLEEVEELFEGDM